MFIDTHTHIYANLFLEDDLVAVQRAIDQNVERLLLPNIDLESIAAMHQVVDRYPANCFPMMGLHPCSVKADFQEVLNQMNLLLENNRYYGIGETGIDLYWDKTFLSEQIESFKIQIGWAKKFQLPLIIHAREAFSEIFEVLDELNDSQLKGIFHCFTGEAYERDKILEYEGFLFGIGGVLTYKKSTLPEVLKAIPLDKIVLETDAPYLAPVPYRGKTNESAYIPYIAEKLTDVYGCSLSEIATTTTQNAQKLFQIP